MKKTIFLISLLLLLMGFLFSKLFIPNNVIAEADDDVFGFAWSENIGWVSLNCINEEIDTPRCSNSNYGVDIEASGNLIGYAWSENIGWIDFAPLGPYPVDPQYSVQADLETGVVTGWARVLSYGSGWDGWLKMDDVTVDNCSGEFFGWAFGDIIGWLSFNSANCDSDGNNITDTGYYSQCPVGQAVVDYIVVSSNLNNDGPTAINLSVNLGDYCVLARRPVFSWRFSDPNPGDTQQYYRILIDDDPNIQDNPLIDSGKIAVTGEGPDYFYDTASPSIFTYNTTFYWGIKVWDDCESSGWITSSFITPLHEYPNSIFEWKPLRPSQNEFTQFCSTAEPGSCDSDVSECYAVGGAKISCSGNIFAWTFPAGAEFSTTTTAASENPKVKFSDDDWQVVSLNIDDGVGSCSVTKNIRISAPLPKWREIAP